MSGEEPGYVPPDHKTTAEFRVPGKAAGMPAAGAGADSTVVDEPMDDLADDLADATLQDLPVDDPEDDPDVTFHDAVEEKAPPAVAEASVTATDIRVEGPVPPVPEQAPEQAAASEQPPMPAPVPGEAPWTERFAAEREPTAPAAPAPAAPAQAAPAQEFAMPSPAPGTAPQPDETAPATPAPMPSGWPPPARSRHPLIVIAVIVAVVLLGAAALLALLFARGGSGDEGKTAAPPSPAVSAPAAGGATGTPAPGAPAPSGAPATPPTEGRPPVQQPGMPPPVTTAPIGPLVDGKGISYQLVQQDEGYFEGKMVITNNTDRPMKTWKLTFRSPGADVKNIWGARLVHGGGKVEIKNLDGAPAIPPGGTWDVQFGAAGTASTPRACELNGKACGF